jgi:hypothetical protein
VIIQPNNEGWSFHSQINDERELLAYDSQQIIYRGTDSVSTTSILFVGTHEEIEQHIAENGLLYPIENNNTEEEVLDL